MRFYWLHTRNTYSSCAQIGVPTSVGEWMWGEALQLGDALKQNRTLQSLTRYGDFGDVDEEAVVAMADALKQKRTLQTLTLHGNATLTTLQLRRPRSGWLPPGQRVQERWRLHYDG